MDTGSKYHICWMPRTAEIHRRLLTCYHRELTQVQAMAIFSRRKESLDTYCLLPVRYRALVPLWAPLLMDKP